MKMRIVIVLFCIAIIIPFASNSRAMNGAALYETCNSARLDLSIEPNERSSLENLNLAACGGYLKGVLDMMQLANKNNSQFYCLPRMTRLQMARVVLRYLKEHPEKHHQTAAEIIILAIEKAFPCKK